MLVAVGGNSRKAGKTSVVCGIIRALPEAAWTAIKISPHAHSAMPGGDTARFLEAGARRALLLAEPPPAWPDGNVIVESGSVRGDLNLFVLDATRPFKDGARAVLDRADAIVLTGGEWSDRRPIFHGHQDPALRALIGSRCRAGS
jgi:hypothetical protein